MLFLYSEEPVRIVCLCVCLCVFACLSPRHSEEKKTSSIQVIKVCFVQEPSKAAIAGTRLGVNFCFANNDDVYFPISLMDALRHAIKASVAREGVGGWGELDNQPLVFHAPRPPCQWRWHATSKLQSQAFTSTAEDSVGSGVCLWGRGLFLT